MLDASRNDLTRCERLLSADEWARVRRMAHAEAARRFIVRRGLLRQLLGTYLDTPPEALVFTYGPQGKPALTAPWARTELRFNLSDSGDLATFVFTVAGEVGVDVELVRQMPDLLKMARRYLSEEELAWVQTHPTSLQSSAFLRCWTCKEAVVKAQGDGLTVDLRAFTIPHWVAPTVRPSPRDATSCLVHRLAPPQGYVAALATPQAVCRIIERSFAL